MPLGILIFVPWVKLAMSARSDTGVVCLGFPLPVTDPRHYPLPSSNPAVFLVSFILPNLPRTTPRYVAHPGVLHDLCSPDNPPYLCCPLLPYPPPLRHFVPIPNHLSLLNVCVRRCPGDALRPALHTSARDQRGCP